VHSNLRVEIDSSVKDRALFLIGSLHPLQAAFDQPVNSSVGKMKILRAPAFVLFALMKPRVLDLRNEHKKARSNVRA
jgi:hypothetical protein